MKWCNDIRRPPIPSYPGSITASDKPPPPHQGYLGTEFGILFRGEVRQCRIKLENPSGQDSMLRAIIFFRCANHRLL